MADFSEILSRLRVRISQAKLSLNTDPYHFRDPEKRDEAIAFWEEFIENLEILSELFSGQPERYIACMADREKMKSLLMSLASYQKNNLTEAREWLQEAQATFIEPRRQRRPGPTEQNRMGWMN